MKGLFGSDKDEKSALSNLNTLFKDEPLLDGMFSTKMDGDDAIFFNGSKYDITDGANFYELREDIEEYLKEKKIKKTSKEVVEQQSGGSTVANTDQNTTTDPNTNTAVVDTSGQNVVKQEAIEDVAEPTAEQTPANNNNQYTEEELSTANPFNESLNKKTGLPNEGSVASTYSEYRGRGVESGPKTHLSFLNLL